MEREAAHGAAKAERARLQRVMAILQRNLPPPDLPRMPGLDAAAYHRPASVDKIGGESCDLFPLGLDRGGFFLDDVCRGARSRSLGG